MGADGDTARLALRKANEVRRANAELRSHIRSGGRRGGATRAARAVQNGGSSLRFLELVRAVPGVGDVTARRMLGNARISPAARVNSELVGGQQRDRLAGQLLAYANGPKHA